MKKNSGIFYLVLGLVTSIILVGAYIAYLILTTPDTPEAQTSADPGTGVTIIEPASEMPDFTLTNQHGEEQNLYSITQKPTLLTFGFTHCPDVCPLTLQEMQKVREELGPLGQELNYVFISVDGQRDTPEVLAQYFTTLGMDSFLIGLTGEEGYIRSLGEDYRLFFAYTQPDEDGNYAVEHTAGIFLLDSQNRWVRRYAFGTEREFIVEDLTQALGGEEG